MITSHEMPTKVVWTFTTRVKSVSRRTTQRYIPGSGLGKDARFRELDLGWYVHLDGSQEALHLGAEQPELAPGDSIKVTLERLAAPAMSVAPGPQAQSPDQT
jgi:hypothetical protein